MLSRFRKALLALIFVAATPAIALAEGTGTTGSQIGQPLLKPEQLEALVAPVALYPDALLANVLAASTYPLEVVQADRWMNEHKNLKGDQLKTEVSKQSWDDSIKALAGTATVLATMSEKLDWTKSLGDAVLAQQPDVMDAIQRLRSRAQKNNKLSSTKEQKVSVQQQESKQVIVIEQTDPNTLYVPYYEPAVVYGEWPYPAYPPYYFAYPPYIGAGVIATGIAFGAGFALGRWSNYWGGGCRWSNNNFFINRNVSNIGNNWQHNPAHRQGVRYSNANVQQRFGNNAARAGAADRMDFRGRSGQQVLSPERGRAGVGERAGGDRIGGGDRAGAERKGATDRGAADRAAAKQARTGERGAGKQAGAGQRGPASAAASRGGRDSALNVQTGRAANVDSARGRASLASAGAVRAAPVGGGGARFSGGGGGGGGGFRGGGGRRSDLALKHDVVLLGHLANGLGYYRFSYVGSNKTYVGVIAQEVQSLRPDAVTRGRDGYLSVHYDRLGLKFRTYKDWLATGAHIPTGSGI